MPFFVLGFYGPYDCFEMTLSSMVTNGTTCKLWKSSKQELPGGLNQNDLT